MKNSAGYFNPLSAFVEQYITLSDGQKKQYTNYDALLEYGSSEILSPDKVSYYSLYVNGVLQPPVNYKVREGLLIFTTEDVPPINAPIVLEFITICGDGCPLKAKNNYYVAKASASQKIFCNKDALPELSTGGIPSLQKTSFQRLFVNGALQSPSSYIAYDGLLVLNTKNAPMQNSCIILQSIYIYTNQYSCQEVSDLIEAIALQESAVSNIIHVVGYELKQILDKNISFDMMLEINKSVAQVIDAIGILNQIQYTTLKQIKESNCMKH